MRRVDYSRGCAGKQKHTRDKAIGKARRNSDRDGVRWSAYPCGQCSRWHIGHNPIDMGTRFGDEMIEEKARRSRGAERFDWRTYDNAQ